MTVAQDILAALAEALPRGTVPEATTPAPPLVVADAAGRATHDAMMLESRARATAAGMPAMRDALREVLDERGKATADYRDLIEAMRRATARLTEDA